MVLENIQRKRPQMRAKLTSSKSPYELMLVRAWLGLSPIVENYEKQKIQGDTINLGDRADIVAAFRTIETKLNLEQSIPRRIR